MTATTPRERSIGSISFVNGTFGTDLASPNTFPQLHYEWLVLRGSGNLIVSGGSSNGTINAEAPTSLIKSVQIVMSGISGDEFINIPLNELKVLTHYIGRRPGLAPKMSAPVATVGTNPFWFEIYLPFTLDDMANSYRGMWASNRYSNIRFRIQWGTVLDVVSGGDRTNSIDPTTKIDVYAREYTNDARFAVANDLLLNQRLALAEVPANVTQSNFDITIPRTASYLRGLLIKQCTIASGTEVPSTAIISGEAPISLLTDETDRKYEYTWNQLIRQNYEMYRTDLPTSGGAPYYAFIDLSPKGDFQTLLNMLSVGTIKLRASVAAVTNGFLRVSVVKYALSA